MKRRILSALYRADDYISGQELCQDLNVSRTAVWKTINQLKEEGYEIQAVSRKGYKILSSPDQITGEEVGARLQTKWLGGEIHYYESIDSTNNEAKRLAEQGAPNGTLILAEKQEKGKGRRGRTWETPGKTSIAMSFLLRPNLSPAQASMVTLVMGLAVAQACRELCGAEAKIKWPNDIVINGRKICGILTEMSAEMECINYLVVGTGINVNQQEFPLEIQDVASSLLSSSGEKTNRAKLAALCLDKFEEYFEAFLRTGDLSELEEEYNRMLAGKDSAVRVLEPGNEHEGISKGINPKGELLVELPDGTTEAVYSGEVSVRGIYGYIG
ncbi:MAG TPA: biotin--[acetyl-CoA-carboxylase] ligase [Candidatus Choladousia intestinigallinarum]|nr:biotin--[acetyl-CoA-carboxylase] ligase [Candidatus Choladousia intestinigallinarum]